MPTRSSSAEWSGNLARGNGTMSLGSGAFEGSYSFASRSDSVETTAQVTIASVDGTPTITRSELSTEVKVDGLDDAEFQEFADGASSGCAVSRALAGVEITLAAKLA